MAESSTFKKPSRPTGNSHPGLTPGYSVTMPKVDHRSVMKTPQEQQTILFCNRLIEEAQAVREEQGISARLDSVSSFMTSQWPKKYVQDKSHRARVSLNVIRSILERQVGMLTESRPNIHIKSISGNKAAAHILEEAISGFWEEHSIQQVLTDGIVTAQRNGFAPCYVPYDSSLDFGRGDMSLDFLPPEDVLFDPTIRRAAELQRGDYVIIKRVRTIPNFWDTYPVRGHLVEPESNLSTYEQGGGGQVQSPVTQRLFSVWAKPSNRQTTSQPAAIPRAYEHRLYYRDRTLDAKNPWIPDPSLPDGVRPNYLYPRLRLIVWAGSVVLYDGPSIYWDGRFPVELLDWGIETDHPYGESQVELLRSLQEALNVLVSGTVDNVRLANDPPWITEKGALLNTELQELRAWGDRMGWVWTPKKGYRMQRDPPGQLTNMVMGVIEFLREAMNLEGGITEVVQGRHPPSVQSGVAIDSLLLAAQIVIRLQARAVEDFLSRTGQLMISRIIQFWTNDRLMFAFGNSKELKEFAFQRQEFIASLGSLSKVELQVALQNMYRDLRFMVTPGSNLAVAKLQKQALMERLFQMKLVHPIEVLKAAEIENPGEKIKEALEFEKAMIAAQAPPAPNMGAPSAPPNPAAESAGIGVAREAAGGAQNGTPG